jgi:hypothetical protein
VGALAPRLLKGTEVYCEGRLSLGTGRDGEAKGGLNPRGVGGATHGADRRRKPKVQSRDAYERPRDEDAMPFDDPLRF